MPNNRLVLFTSTIAEGGEPLRQTLSASTEVATGIRNTSVDEIIVMPRMTPKVMVNALAKEINRGKGKLDFSGAVVVTDRKMDDTTTIAIDRFTQFGLAAAGPFDAIDDTPLDVKTADGTITLDSDNEDFRSWLLTGQAPVEPTPEEKVADQLSNLFGDLDLDLVPDQAPEVAPQSEEGVPAAPADSAVDETAEIPEVVEGVRGPEVAPDTQTDSQEVTGGAISDVSTARHAQPTNDDLNSQNSLSEETENSSWTDGDSTSTSGSIVRTTSDAEEPGGQSVPRRSAPEGAPEPSEKIASKPSVQSLRSRYSLAPKEEEIEDDDSVTDDAFGASEASEGQGFGATPVGEDQPAPETSAPILDANTVDDFTDSDFTAIFDEEDGQEAPSSPEDASDDIVSAEDMERAIDEASGEIDFDAPGDFADEIPAIQLSQAELLNRDDSPLVDPRESGVLDAHIDDTVDDNGEDDYGVPGARAAEPVMVNPAEEAQEEPEILRKRKERNAKSRRVVEALIPDPSTFDERGDEPTLDQLRQNEGGTPKDEAHSAAPDTPRRMKNDSNSEEQHESGRVGQDSNGAIGVEDKPQVATRHSSSSWHGATGARGSARRSRVGYQAQEVQVSDNFDAMKGRRHRQTRAMAVSGPNGGSGKTTTTYGLALASAAVDRGYSKQRSEQWTWVIELDYRTPKYFNRMQVDESQTMLAIVKEFQRRDGDMSDEELIEYAKEHSYPLYGEDLYPKARILMAPPQTAYGEGSKDITANSLLLVAERLIHALSVNRNEPSTIFLDMPDYAGEALDRTATLANKFCDSVVVVFPDNGDLHDVMTVVAAMRNQKRARVDPQRISIIGTRVTRDQAKNQERAISDMQIHFAGYIPHFRELDTHVNDYDEDADDNPAERKSWILNVSKPVIGAIVLRSLRLLAETRINPMAEPYLADREREKRESNPARNGGNKRKSSSAGSTQRRSGRSGSKRRGEASKKSSKGAKKSGGLGSLFGITKK